MGVEQARVKEIASPAQAFGVIVFNKNNEVLLVRHKKAPKGTVGNKPGIFGLPSGIGERLKTPKINALEELEEEAGIITIPEYLSPFSGNTPPPTSIPRFDDRGREVGSREIQMTAFVYTGPRNLRSLRASKETVPMWVSQEELNRLDRDGHLLPNVKDLISNAKRFLGQ